ncbi:hypothetical protein SAMN05443551_1442 [Marivita hallyeonensis]|uniref:Uncharacterized protein n=1 Tax=Marivita hallyeonensis TaxID=996342 RepID=A0A1M5QP73_9RHOB|nr:hypothetical protein SAMN05443551_1442 [Marivita hallyeonensis]
MLEFQSSRYEDAELKSKDDFIISYIENKPIILQNLNVAKYWKLNNGPVGIWAVLVALTIILLLLLLLL